MIACATSIPKCGCFAGENRTGRFLANARGSVLSIWSARKLRTSVCVIYMPTLIKTRIDLKYLCLLTAAVVVGCPDANLIENVYHMDIHKHHKYSYNKLSIIYYDTQYSAIYKTCTVQ